MYKGTRNITISLETSNTPMNRKLNAVFNLTNEDDENEIQLKLELENGVLKSSELTSKNTSITILNICSDFMKALSVEEFNYKKERYKKNN